MKLEPLLFNPKLCPKIWGGRRLEGYGKALEPGALIGESWDIYDRPGDSAVVARGAFKGSTLNSLMLEFGPQLLGQKAFEQEAPYFPLFVKLIDANDALSVQVHPNDDLAARMVGPDELGKTEMWVVLEAEPGARMTAGLKPGVDSGAFQAALKAGKLESVLNDFAVKPGDVIFVPAGRVHAIGKGCLVAEVQQNSDTTWRVYDYGRLENGKPRDLHVSQALECIRFDAEMQALPSLQAGLPRNNGETLLVECDYFKVSRVALNGRFKPPAADPVFHMLMVTEGAPNLLWDEKIMPLAKGQTVLIPAVIDWEIVSSGQPMSLIWSRP